MKILDSTAIATRPALTRAVAMILVAGLLSGAVLPRALHALEFTQVRMEKIVFDPARGESAQIKFHLDASADVEMRVFDGREIQIRTIAAKTPAGDAMMAWDGKDESGRAVPPEAYHFTLRASADDGATAVYDVSDATGGGQITAQNVTWDSANQRIRYRLAETARVNIRVGLRDNGPLLRTIVDWVARPGGDNQESWDGWDASHVLDLAKHPKLDVFVDAYALSANTILVGPLATKVQFVPIAQAQQTVREQQSPPPPKLMHYHSQQPLETRGDVDIRVSLAKNGARDAEGLPIVSGLVPLRLDVDPKDRQRVIERRFEPVFFVDGAFAFENEVGYLPFNWIWNTDGVNEGIHYVSANIRGYDGNFGMTTLKVHVKHGPDGSR